MGIFDDFSVHFRLIIPSIFPISQRLGRLRPDRRDGRGALGPLRNLPEAEVLALVADDHPAVEVEHHRGRLAHHPPRRLLDSEAPALPTDDVTVENHANGFETEVIFQVKPFEQRLMKVLRLLRFALELRVDLGELTIQEAVGLLQG